MRVLIFVCTMTAIIGASTETALAQHALRESSRQAAPLYGESKDRYRIDIDWGYSRRLSGNAHALFKSEHPSSQSAAISGGMVQGGQVLERDTKACDPLIGAISSPMTP